MTIQTISTRCPACRHPVIVHESGDRHRCARCRWQIRITPDGKAVDYLSLRTAEHKTKRRGNRNGRINHNH